MGLYQGMFLIGFMRFTHTDRQTDRQISPIGHNALGYFTHDDKEQDEGEDPAEVVSREMQPSAVMDVHLGALTPPTYSTMIKSRYMAYSNIFLSDRKGCKLSLRNKLFVHISKSFKNNLHNVLSLSHCNNNGADFTLDIQKNHILRIWGS